MKTTLLIQMLSRSNSHAFAAPRFSLTPCFRWVCSRHHEKNRFNGFTLLLSSLALLISTSAAQAQQALGQNAVDSSLDSSARVVAETPYAVAARDGNQKIWSKV